MSKAARYSKMGRAYSEDQKVHVKNLLEQGRDEETIEKETGVSDRTIRRWKLELERTGRIGKVYPHQNTTHCGAILTLNSHQRVELGDIGC